MMLSNYTTFDHLYYFPYIQSLGDDSLDKSIC